MKFSVPEKHASNAAELKTREDSVVNRARNALLNITNQDTGEVTQDLYTLEHEERTVRSYDVVATRILDAASKDAGFQQRYNITDEELSALRDDLEINLLGVAIHDVGKDDWEINRLTKLDTKLKPHEIKKVAEHVARGVAFINNSEWDSRTKQINSTIDGAHHDYKPKSPKDENPVSQPVPDELQLASQILPVVDILDVVTSGQAEGRFYRDAATTVEEVIEGIRQEFEGNHLELILDMAFGADKVRQIKEQQQRLGHLAVVKEREDIAAVAS
jgi:HD-GYP domain-containing protein (c-di-GMP phosphodiesterase class II)